VLESLARSGAPLRQKYTRFVQLQNKAAQELGFSDMGAMWRSNYDMTPERFAAEVERLWAQSVRCMSRCTPSCAPGL